MVTNKSDKRSIIVLLDHIEHYTGNDDVLAASIVLLVVSTVNFVTMKWTERKRKFYGLEILLLHIMFAANDFLSKVPDIPHQETASERNIK